MIQFKRLLKYILLKLNRAKPKYNQYKNAELVNLAFGHSRGNYELDRNKYQDIVWHFLDNNGFDNYGYYKDYSTSAEDNASFENNTFVVRPYYWGDDEDIKKLPNFLYKPTKFEIRWYKYALRDSYSNQIISPEEMTQMFEDCAESMRKDNNHVQR